jgi:hypothetical protein
MLQFTPAREKNGKNQILITSNNTKVLQVSLKILHKILSCLISKLYINLLRSVARGGSMGHLHPPNPNCLALDIIDFSKLYIKELIIKIDFK